MVAGKTMVQILGLFNSIMKEFAEMFTNMTVIMFLIVQNLKRLMGLSRLRIWMGLKRWLRLFS